jgi:hypothetical protein
MAFAALGAVATVAAIRYWAAGLTGSGGTSRAHARDYADQQRAYHDGKRDANPLPQRARQPVPSESIPAS